MFGWFVDEVGFNCVLKVVGDVCGFDFVDCMLDILGVSYCINFCEWENILVDGLVLVVVNYLLGMVDVLVLLYLVGLVCLDVCILGNDWLVLVELLCLLLLLVDVFGKGVVLKMCNIYCVLDNGEVLIVFLVGEVLWLGFGGLCDGVWFDGFVCLVLCSKVLVLFIYVVVCNLVMFYGVFMFVKLLFIVMLLCEVVILVW